MTLKELLARALGSDAAHEYELRERQNQITDELVDDLVAHHEKYNLAASKDPNARLESETPDE